MKKSKLSILLLFLVMILAISAVSAADTNDTSDSVAQAVDEAPVDEVASSDVDAVAATDDAGVLSAGEQNFTSLQDSIDGITINPTIRLSSDIVKADGESEITVSKQTVIILGDNHKIDAKNIGGIFKISPDCTLMLQEVTLINANGNAIYNQGNLILNGVTIIDNTAAEGGAIYGVGQNNEMDISHSYFINNTGGAVVSEGGKLFVDDCTFSENTADDGAAILVEDTNVLSIKNSIFEDNRAEYTGGALCIYNVYQDASIAIDNSTFRRNDAVQGGAISTGVAGNVHEGYLVINDCTFDANTVHDFTGAQSLGSAICVGSEEGGLFTLEITGSTFINHVTGANGAVVADQCNLKVDDCEFKDNSANAGAALFAQRGTLTITDSDFTSNQAIFNSADPTHSGFAGAVYAENNAILSIENCKFVDNGGIIGGAVRSNGKTTIKNSNFTDNEATVQGGAIAVKGELDVQDSVFDGNKVTTANVWHADVENGGAAIYAGKGASLTVTGSNFTANEGVRGYNQFTQGGAIFTNQAKEALIDTCVFDSNIAGVGGAILFENLTENNAVIKNSVFNNNQAWQGGAINVNNDVNNVVITDSNFTGNKAVEPNLGDASTMGGAIVIGDVATVDVAGCNFKQNDGVYGGAIMTATNSDAVLNVDDCTFEENTADYGGAISANSKSANVKDSTFVNNVATTYGGAIIVGSGSNTITGSNFTGNSAAYGSAVANMATLELSGNNFSDTSTDVMSWGAGKIITNWNITVMDGKDYYVNFNDILLYAVVTDDNGNLIQDYNLKFTFNGEAVANAAWNAANSRYEKLYTPTKEGTFVVSVNAEGDNVDIKTATISFTRTLSDLNRTIAENTGGIIDLNGSYAYIADYDAGLEDGIVIDKDIVINGNGYTLNGNNLVRIFKVTSGNLTLNNLTITQAVADNGGAIYVANGAILDADYVNFTDNTAAYKGGAIYSKGTVLVNHTVFDDNNISKNMEGDAYKYYYGGAAIYNYDGILTVDNSLFKDNVKDYAYGITEDDGYKLYGAITTSGTVVITNSNFTGNKGRWGSSISMEPLTANNASILIDNCNFTNNLGYQGGAINLGDSMKLLFTIKDCWFEDNVACGRGSGKYSAMAGAVYVDLDENYAKGKIIGTTFLNNRAIDVVVNPDPEASPIVAGALEFDCNEMIIEDTVFIGNTAVDRGGALYVYTAVSTKLNNVLFRDNEAGDAGAIWAYDNVKIIDSTFTNNKATENGGAILFTKFCTQSSIENSNFTGNTANNGGAVYIDTTNNATWAANVAISNSNFTDNVATGEGNAIYQNKDSTLELHNNDVSSQQADIVSTGEVVSTIIIKIMNNGTEYPYYGSIILQANVTDDVGNLMYISGLNLTVNDTANTQVPATYNPTSKLYEGAYTPIKVGKYTIGASYKTTSNLDITPAEIIIVNDNVTSFIVEVMDIVQGENATVEIALVGVNDEGLNATVTVYINNKPITITVQDGYGSQNVSGLDAGQYPVFAQFNDVDGNYNTAYNSTVFYVKSTQANLTVEIEDIKYGEVVTVNIYLTDANGNPLTAIVALNIAGEDYYVPVIEGNASLDIPEKLNVDRYNYTATFENELYNTTIYENSFNVMPREVYLAVRTDDGVAVGEEGEIKVVIYDDDDNVFDGEEVELTFTNKTGDIVGACTILTSDNIQGPQGSYTIDLTKDWKIGMYYVAVKSKNFIFKQPSEDEDDEDEAPAYYQFTSYAGDGTEWGTGIAVVLDEKILGYIPVGVVSNSYSDEFVGEVFFIVDSAVADGETLYELHNRSTGDGIGVWVKVSPAFEYPVHKKAIDAVVIEGDGEYVYGGEHIVVIELGEYGDYYGFTSYGDEACTIEYGTGIVEVDDRVGKYISVKVMSNDFDDRFVGQTFYVLDDEYGEDEPVQLHMMNDNDEIVPVDLWVKVFELRGYYKLINITCPATVEVYRLDDDVEEYIKTIETSFEDGRLSIDLSGLETGDYILKVQIDDATYELHSHDYDRDIEYPYALLYTDDYLFRVVEDHVYVNNVNGTDWTQYGDERIFNFELWHHYWIDDDEVDELFVYNTTAGVIIYKVVRDEHDVILSINEIDSYVVNITDGISGSINLTYLGVGEYKVTVMLNDTNYTIEGWDEDAPIVYEYTSYNEDGTVEYGSGTVEVIGEAKDGFIPVVVISNLPDSSFDGQLFYIKDDAKEDGETLNQLYGEDGNAIPIWVTVSKFSDKDTPYYAEHFNVDKANVEVNVTVVGQITYGKNETVTVTVVTPTGEKLNETVEINIMGKESFNVTLVNGTVTFNLTGYDVGTYTIWVNFFGNDNFWDSYNNINGFSVDKATPQVSVADVKIPYGNDAVINVNVIGVIDDIVQGTVIVTVNGTEYVVKDGKVTVPAGLASGVYNITARFIGNDNYNEATNDTAKLNITASEVTIVTISVTNVTYGTEPTVTITLKDGEGKDISGLVNVSISGLVGIKGVPVVDGVASYPLENMNAGSYSITATINGVNDTANFTVAQAESSIEITSFLINDKYPGRVTISYKVVNVTEVNVTVTDENQNVVYNETISGQTGTYVGGFVVDELSVGTYNVRIDNAETQNYQASTISLPIKVEKAVPEISAFAEDTFITLENTVTVTVSPNATGNVTIIVNGKEYTAEIEGTTATATIEAKDIIEGENSVYVMFNGDGNYTMNYNSTTFWAYSNVVTNDTFFAYFDDVGVLLDTVPFEELVFLGEFSDLGISHITIMKDGLTIEGAEAELYDIGFTIAASDVTLNDMALIANGDLGDLIEIAADGATVSNMDISYTTSEPGNAIRAYEGADDLTIVNNTIYFESTTDKFVDDEDDEFYFTNAISIDSGADMFDEDLVITGVVIDNNDITAVIPSFSNGGYDHEYYLMGLSNVNAVRINGVEELRFTNNNVSVDTNALNGINPTLQALYLAHVDGLVDGNDITMIDTFTPEGKDVYLYAMEVLYDDVTISNNDFYIFTDGGIADMGAAYVIQAVDSEIEITGNNMTTVANGPNLAVYLPGGGTGAPCTVDMENNFISVTGLATTTTGGLVAGIEVQTGDVFMKGNTIYTYNIGDYDEDNYITGIAYAQTSRMDGSVDYQIINNTVFTEGKYTVLVSNKTNSLEVTDNYLIAHDLYGDESVKGIDGATIEDNLPGKAEIIIDVKDTLYGNGNIAKIAVIGATGDNITVYVNGNLVDAVRYDDEEGVWYVTIDSALIVEGENTISVTYNGYPQDLYLVTTTNQTTFTAYNNTVTKDNFFTFFDDEGSINYVPFDELIFKGEFDNLVDVITIDMPITITGDNATLYDMAFKVVSEGVTLRNMNMSYIAGEDDAVLIDVSKSNVNILDNNIYFESDVDYDFQNAMAIYVHDASNVVIDNNNITASLTAVRSYWSIYYEYGTMGIDKVHAIRIDNAKRVELTNNNVDAIVNGGLSTYVESEWGDYWDTVSLESVLILDSSDILVDSNNFTVTDPITPEGIPICLYGMTLTVVDNIAIYNNNFDLSTDGGVDGSGTAYPIQLATCNVDIIGNNITTVNNGPNIGVYISGVTEKISSAPNPYYKESFTVNIKGNDITVFGNASTPNGYASLVSGIEACAGEIIAAGNDIYVYNNAGYVEGANVYGVSQAQTLKDYTPVFEVVGNTVIVPNADYAVGFNFINTAEVTGNFLVANELYGDKSVKSIDNSVVKDNYPAELNITASVENVTVDTPVVINVETNTLFSGNVTLMIGSNSYDVEIVNGVGSYTFADGLPAANYTYSVSYIGYPVDPSDFFVTDVAQGAFSVDKYETIIEISTGDVVIDEPLEVSIKIGNLNGTVTVTGSAYQGTVAVSNGEGRFTIARENMTYGSKSIVVIVSNNDKYADNLTTYNFEVKKAENYTFDVNITVPDMNIRDDLTFNVTLPEDANGRITVKVDGNSTGLYADVLNGNATVFVPASAFTAGRNNTIEVTFNPDGDKYSQTTVAKEIYVNKLDYDFSASAEDIELGENAIIVVKLPEGADGDVYAELQGDYYDAVDGIIIIEDLPVGEYTATVYFEDDTVYEDNMTIVTFNVTKVVIPAEDAFNITTPENATAPEFTIELPEDATGFLLLDINGTQTFVPLVNGTATARVPEGFAPGNYSAVVTYTGDNKYDPITTTQNITVTSNVPDNAFTIPDTAKDGEPLTYAINLPSDAKGYLEVDVDGTKHVVALVNGSASITVPGLSAGSHNVTVSYTGDGKYSPVTKSVAMNVPAPVYKITNNNNVAAIYSANANYKVLITKDGKAVGAGESVNIVFNGKTYTVKTDSKGYATLNLNTKVKVKTYTVTAEYKGVKVSNKVTIKHVIKAKNVSVKKSKKVNKIKVKTNKVNGKFLKGKKLTLKIKGKKIKAKINKKGVATFKVKKSVLKKLKVGKKYKYTVTYGKDKVTKKVKVKR